MSAEHPGRFRALYAVVFGLTLTLHLPALTNYFDNDDAWNYVLEADMAWSGEGSAYRAGSGYFSTRNVHRLIPDMSFVPRWVLFDLWVPGWKIPSVLLHALNAVLLTALARRLGLTLAGAAVAGLLVGLSPLHVHTVSWIGGTYDLFLGGFALGAVLAFLDGRTVLATALGIGAALSKEPGVVIVPVMALVWVCYRRHEGWRTGARKLLPIALGVGLVFLARRLQLGWLGGGVDPTAAVRAVVFDPLELAWKVPLATFAALGQPLQDALSIDVLALALVSFAVILTALVFQRALWRSPVVSFSLLSAFAFVAPAAALREYGQGLTLEDLLFSSRYLYLSHLFGAPVVAMACVGFAESLSPLRRTAVALVLGLSLATGAYRVYVAAEPDPPTRLMAETLRSVTPKSGRHVYVLSSIYRESTFRLLMSRWLPRTTGAVFHFVQRGSWRVLERRPDKTDGLDFVDGYVRARKEPFDPAEVQPDRGDLVFLLVDRGPPGGHELRPVTLAPARDRGPGRRSSVPLEWSVGSSPFSFSIERSGPDGWTFGLGPESGQPRDYLHRPLVQTLADAPAQDVLGVRVTYTATAPPRRIERERAFERGYLELHWRGHGDHAGDPDTAFGVLPLELDGRRHTDTLWLDIDPAFAELSRLAAIAIHPIDRPGRVVVHQVDLLLVPPPVRQ